MHLTIYGCGTVGARVAARWKGGLTLVTRSEARQHELSAAFPHARIVREPVIEGHVLIAVPASAQPALLATLPTVDGPAVLVSTTSVHRPYQGTISASSPYGTSERAQRNAATEQAFFDWAGEQARVVRLAGLFSDHRGPAALYARTGSARLGPPNVPLPLIHDDDAATVLLQALAGGPRIRIGVAHQPTRQAYYRHWATTLGLDEPPFSEPATPYAFEGVAPDAPVDWRDVRVQRDPGSTTPRPAS